MYDKKKLTTGIVFLLLALLAVFGIVHEGAKSYYITVVLIGTVLGIGCIRQSKINR